MTKLTIYLARPDPVLMLAAKRLRASWKGPIKVVLGTPQDKKIEGPHVFIDRGALLSRALLVWWRTGFAGDVGSAIELALSSAAWDGATVDPWRWLTRPEPQALRLGTPDERRTWWITTPELADEVARAKQADVQLHCLGFSRARSKADVTWLPTRRSAGFLLNRSEAVVAPPGALAFDAARVGVRLLDPATLEPWEAQFDPRLPGCVPESVVDSPDFWLQVVRRSEAEAGGEAPTALATPDCFKLGRALAAERRPTAWQVVQRKAMKFWREPQRFFADSWALKPFFARLRLEKEGSRWS